MSINMKNTKQTSKIPFGYVVYLGIVLFVIVGSTNYIAYRDVKRHLLQSMDSIVHAKLTTLVEMSGYYIHYFELELLEQLKNHTLQEEGVEYLVIVNARNKPFFNDKRKYGKYIKEYQHDIMYKSTTLGTIFIGIDTKPYMQDITTAAGNAIGSMFLIKLFLSNLLLHLALNPGKNQVPYSPLHERLRTYV